MAAMLKTCFDAWKSAVPVPAGRPRPCPMCETNTVPDENSICMDCYTCIRIVASEEGCEELEALTRMLEAISGRDRAEFDPNRPNRD